MGVEGNGHNGNLASATTTSNNNNNNNSTSFSVGVGYINDTGTTANGSHLGNQVQKINSQPRPKTSPEVYTAPSDLYLKATNKEYKFKI